MMNEYIFVETGSRSIVENGEQLRVVSFRGTDQSSSYNDRYNVDGSFTMPLMDYFMAGMEGRLEEVIRAKVVGRFALVEPEVTE